MSQQCNVCWQQVTAGPAGGGGKVGHVNANRVQEEKKVCSAGKRFGIVACEHGTNEAVRLNRCRVAVQSTKQWSDCHEIGLDAKPHRGDIAFVMELPAKCIDGVTLTLKPSVRVTKYREIKPKSRCEWMCAYNTFKDPSSYSLEECSVSLSLPSSAFHDQVRTHV